MIVVSRNTVRLLRIPFSFFLAPVFLLALSQANAVDPFKTVLSFFIIHLLVYPSSNGYNSYVDRDTGSIGGLEKPPMPGKDLYYVTLVLDLLAILLATAVHITFSLCVAIYILASRAYSGNPLRLKRHPLLSFFTVIFFQGGFSVWMCMMAITDRAIIPDSTHMLLLTAASLQIAAAYPLTQVYQHKADASSGIKSLSMMLGIKGTFVFTIFCFTLCNLFYFLYFKARDHISAFVLLQIFFAPAIVWFVIWFRKVMLNRGEANFINVMRMNFISSCCSAACFICLSFQ